MIKKRLVWIDVLRLIGIIGVILIHIVSNTMETFGGLSDNAHKFYVFIHFLFEFSVPLFIMISGMMFLKKKDITFKEMFKKYILKIILIILVFGTGMILMEEVFINKNVSLELFKKVIIRLLEGDIWAHMWYLYLILGLYLITPAFILITNNIKEKEYKIFLVILFSLTILLSLLNSAFKVNIAFNMINISGYIFYYLYGHFLYSYTISNKFKILNYILAFLGIIYTIYRASTYNSLDYIYGYTTIVPCVLASSLVLLLKDRDIKLKINNIINNIGICSLGIYIIHQFFINIIYKVLKFDLIVSYPYIGLIIYLIVIFLCSYVTTYLLRKIKFVREYFL